MTSTEKQELLSKLSQQEADLQTKLQMTQDERRALEATPVTTYKVWEPTEDTKFVWYSQDKRRKHWLLCPYTQKEEALQLGVAHPTEEAAERHHSFLVMLHDLHKFAVEHNEGWKPDWEGQAYELWFERSGEEIAWNSVYNAHTSILPHFKSALHAQKAIDTFGDRLKILFEYYNS